MDVETFRKVYTPERIRELISEEERQRQVAEDEHYRLLGGEIERYPIYHPRRRRGS